MDELKKYWEMEVRAVKAGGRLRLTGKIPYRSLSEEINPGWREMLWPGCFADSIRRNDIYFILSHDSAKPQGSTASGTLRLNDTTSGLEFEVDLPNTQAGRDLHEQVRRGDFKKMSFGFIKLQSHFEQIDGEKVDIVTKANLLELSPVVWPAYPSTSLQARSKNNRIFLSEERKQEMQNLKKYWQEKGFKDYEEYLRTVARYGRYNDGGRDWEEIDHRLATGMDSAGFETPDNFMYDLLRGLNGSELFKRCTVYQLGEYNNLKLPAVDEKTRSDSQFGGAKSYWEEEAEQLTDSKPDFRMVNLYVKKLISLAYVTDELLANGLENYLFNILSTAKARRINQAILHGTGAGQWLGIIPSGAAVVADAVGGQAAGTFVAENAGQMVKHLDENSHGRDTAWLINPELYATLCMQQYNGVDQSANLIKWRSGGERFNKMLGFDMIPCEACSAPGTVGDIGLFAMNQYIVAEKAVKKAISGHVRFYNDESCFKLTYRADGAPAWATPVLSEKSGIQVSPFIVLADRS